MKEFKEGFHKFLVGITLISGAMYSSTWAHYLFEKINAPAPAPFIFQMIVFFYIAKKTAYHTEFKYDKK